MRHLADISRAKNQDEVHDYPDNDSVVGNDKNDDSGPKGVVHDGGYEAVRSGSVLLQEFLERIAHPDGVVSLRIQVRGHQSSS